MIATILLLLGLHSHSVTVLRNYRGEPRPIAIPAGCAPHTRVWLNGRKLRNGVDYGVLPLDIIPSRALETEWATGDLRVKF